MGDWSGGFFDTGHPVANTLKEINWVGKSFTSVDHVDPVVVEVNGRRVSWGKWGFASVSLPDQSVPRVIDMLLNHEIQHRYAKRSTEEWLQRQ